MGLLKQSDLRYSYSWTTVGGDNPAHTGFPDDIFLNRNEGYEVLYFINKFAETHGLRDRLQGLKVEKLIKEHLPSNIRSQERIKNWLELNWHKY